MIRMAKSVRTIEVSNVKLNLVMKPLFYPRNPVFLQVDFAVKSNVSFFTALPFFLPSNARRVLHAKLICEAYFSFQSRATFQSFLIFDLYTHSYS